MDHLTTALVSILTAVIGVAFLAVLVSRNATTVGVINAGGSAFSQILNAATSPVSGGGIGNFNINAPVNSNLGY